MLSLKLLALVTLREKAVLPKVENVEFGMASLRQETYFHRSWKGQGNNYFFRTSKKQELEI